MMLGSLMIAGFSIMSARAGEHWMLKPGEAQALAEPLAAIMERHSLTEKAGEYGDYIALLVAVAMIVFPKVMISLDKRKKGGNNVVKLSSVPAGGGIPKPAAQPEAGKSPRPAGESDSGAGASAYGPSDVKRSLGWITG